MCVCVGIGPFRKKISQKTGWTGLAGQIANFDRQADSVWRVLVWQLRGVHEWYVCAGVAIV